MSVSVLTLPAPGWYPDPTGNSIYRWWDGEGWTEGLHDGLDAETRAPVRLFADENLAPVVPDDDDFILPAEAFTASAPEPVVVPEPVAVQEPEPEQLPEALPFPEPVPLVEPAAFAPVPQPSAFVPQPVIVEPEPMFVAPEPVAPEPIAVAPAPVAEPIAPQPLVTETTQPEVTADSGPVLLGPPVVTERAAKAPRARAPKTRWSGPLTAFPIVFPIAVGMVVAIAYAGGATANTATLIVIAASAGVLLLIPAFILAEQDRRELLQRGAQHAPSLAWMLLAPPVAYLIARTRARL